jgi:hypothetical protein
MKLIGLDKANLYLLNSIISACLRVVELFYPDGRHGQVLQYITVVKSAIWVDNANLYLTNSTVLMLVIDHDHKIPSIDHCITFATMITTAH